MALGFKYFHSGQPGAPVLTGEVGKLIDVLDWALDVGDAVLGFEKVFSGTNAAVYRSRYGVRPYLDVNDNGVLAGLGRDARLRGYESMSGLGVGDSPFPLLTSVATVCQRKSQLATSAPRAYRGIKTAEMLVLFVNCDNDGITGTTLVFGQVPSLHPSENYPCLLMGGSNSAAGAFGLSTQGATGSISSLPTWGGQSINNVSAAWMRNPAGSLKAPYASARISSTTAVDVYQIIDGSEISLVRAEVMASDIGNGISRVKPRSYIPNLWTTAADLAAAGWSIGDSFELPDYSPGSSFVWAGTCCGNVIIETTDTGGAV